MVILAAAVTNDRTLGAFYTPLFKETECQIKIVLLFSASPVKHFNIPVRHIYSATYIIIKTSRSNQLQCEEARLCGNER